MKIRPFGAELSHADGWMSGRTDRHDESLIVAFRNSPNAPKNCKNE